MSDPAWWNYEYTMTGGFNVANNYTKFEWYFSGFTSQGEATAKLEESLEAFLFTHDQNEWTVSSTVKQNVHGWTSGFTAVKEAREEPVV